MSKTKPKTATKPRKKKLPKVAATPVVVEPFRVTLRGLTEQATAGAVYEHTNPLDAIRAAWGNISYPGAEPVMSWKGTDVAALLDVDFRIGNAPSLSQWLSIINRIHPQPASWWVSHGGGLHALYVGSGNFLARDLAAIARMYVRTLSLGESKVEILCRTRHPGYRRGDQQCSKVYDGFLSVDSVKKARSALMGEIDRDDEIDPEQLTAWLEDNQFVLGGRYAHDRCPNDSRPNSSGGKPVVVLDGGIQCFVCGGDGPGFFPFRQLIEGASCKFSPLRSLVRNLTHWPHARHVIKCVTNHEDEDGYRALLRLWHVTDPKQQHATVAEQLVAKVFSPELPIVRGAGIWLDADTFQPASKDGLAALITSLPAVQFIAQNGAVKVAAHMVGKFQGGFDLAKYGYASLFPLRGVDMAEDVRLWRGE